MLKYMDHELQEWQSEFRQRRSELSYRSSGDTLSICELLNAPMDHPD